MQRSGGVGPEMSSVAQFHFKKWGRAREGSGGRNGALFNLSIFLEFSKKYFSLGGPP